eukprot:g10026.t1
MVPPPYFDWTEPEAIRAGAAWAADQERQFRLDTNWISDPAEDDPNFDENDPVETYGVTDKVKEMRIVDSFRNKFEVKPIAENPPGGAGGQPMHGANLNSQLAAEHASTAAQPFYHMKKNAKVFMKDKPPPAVVQEWSLTWIPGKVDKYQTATIRSFGGQFPGKHLQNRTVRNLSQNMPAKQSKTIRKEDFEIIRRAFASVLGTTIERHEVDPGSDPVAGKIMVQIVETSGFSDKSIILDEKSESAAKLVLLLTKMVEAVG